MIITVTQEHIDKGVKKHCERCALSLAFHDSGFPKAGIGVMSVWPFGLDKEHEQRRWDLPEKAVSFREGFDGGWPVKPFTFEMHIPTC